MSSLRFYPENKDRSFYEHIHRYLFAKELVKGLDVLDISCGEGYGSKLLSENARAVLGADIDKDIIESAKIKYESENLHFCVNDCTKMTFEDNSFDCIISFETIEHVEEQEKFLFEIKRVLKPNGILIISTPDTYEYSFLRNYNNPDHIKEFTKKEFQTFLASKFNNVVLFGQRFVQNSIIFPCGIENNLYKMMECTKSDSWQPMYLLACCSNNKLDLSLQGLIFGDKDSDNEFLRACEGIHDLEDQLKGASSSISELKNQIYQAQIGFQDKDSQIESARRTIEQKDEEIDDNRKHIDQLNNAIQNYEKQLEKARITILEKDKEIILAQKTIGAKDYEINKAKETIKTKDIEIDNKDILIDKYKENDLINKKEIEERKEEIICLHSKITEMEEKFIFKILKKFKK